MSPLKNLSVIRKLVQVAAFILFVYGSGVGAYYLADKLTHALPALSCAYDLNGSDICALIPIQHQMDHRLGPVINEGGDILQGIMPTLITLGTFLVFFIFLNKAFCGWLCPLGTFQELLHNLGQKLGLQRRESVDPKLVKGMRPVKWAMLGALVFGFPLLTGLGYLNHDLGSPFCAICPSRILTTLANGETNQLVVDTASTTTMVLSILADFLFGLMIALSLTIRQPSAASAPCWPSMPPSASWACCDW
jgi:ferredoxin-type protein NapH